LCGDHAKNPQHPQPGSHEPGICKVADMLAFHSHHPGKVTPKQTTVQSFTCTALLKDTLGDSVCNRHPGVPLTNDDEAATAVT